MNIKFIITELKKRIKDFCSDDELKKFAFSKVILATTFFFQFIYNYKVIIQIKVINIFNF